MQGLEIVNADENTVYNTFDHSENNLNFDSGNDLLFLRQFDPKDKYRAESYEITLKNPIFYPKIPGTQLQFQVLGSPHMFVVTLII